MTQTHVLDEARARLLWTLRMRMLSHDPAQDDFRPNEAATVAALTIITRQMFRRAVDVGDWVGLRDGLTYDACSPTGHGAFDAGRYAASLRKHLLLTQGIDRVVIDLRVDGVEAPLIRRIGALVRSFDAEAQARVVSLCRNETDRAAFLG